MHYTLKKKGVNRESSNERKKREGRARMEEEKVQTVNKTENNQKKNTEKKE